MGLAAQIGTLAHLADEALDAGDLFLGRLVIGADLSYPWHLQSGDGASGGQSTASYLESAADWPPPVAYVMPKPQVAYFYAAQWPDSAPALTP